MFSKREAISFGWNTAKSNLGFFILLLLLYFGVFVVFGMMGYFLEKNAILSAVVNLVSSVINLIFALGFIKIYLKLVDGQKPNYSDLYSTYPFFFKYLLGSIIFSLIVVGGLILLIIPGIYFALKFLLFPYFIVDKGVGPIAALKMSSQATKGAKINFLLFGILLWLIMLGGILALVVGLFIAVPTVGVAMAFVYRKLASQVTS